ncbi:MAG: hypothetical protein GY816_21325 [Cytophagales bacterium]|nr:hypothetical protein [Cytophagales bacterium]
MVNAGLIIAYILIGLCALAAIVLPLMQAAGNPGSLKKIGISFGGMVVVFFICYLIAGNDTMGLKDVTASASKKVGAGLFMFYVLLVGAIGSIVYTEFHKLSK